MNIKNSIFFAESWNVAFRKTAVGAIFSDKTTKFNVIPNPVKFWAADPMVFKHCGKLYIFAELYDYKLGRGTIGYTTFDGEHFQAWKQVIVEDFHMSYPFIFCIGESIYMIPETSDSNKLILYKAVSFPDQWEQTKIIAENVRWVDTTLLMKENNILAYTEQLSDPHENLFLVFDNSFNLVSKKVIAVDSKTMRCGGRLFDYKEELVRVCQDCEKKYGGALLFRFCNSQSLNERTSIRIEPDEFLFDCKVYLDGMHTYSSLQEMEVIDIKTRRFNIYNLYFRVLNKLTHRGI